MFLQRPNYAMVGRSHASPDGGGFPGDAHRLATIATDYYDCNGLLRLQRITTIATGVYDRAVDCFKYGTGLPPQRGIM
jgi:hypothetical protein